MLKETKTEKTIVFLVTFLSFVAFQLGGRAPWPPHGFAYAECWLLHSFRSIFGTGIYL